LAISLGQICVNDINYFTISPASPIGTKLIGLKAGDKFVFNKKDVEILEVS
jgi:transcription elongation GreA/GreB family factor